MKLTKAEWLNLYKDKLSDRDMAILDKAYEVLKTNTIIDKKLPWGEKPVIFPWIKNNFSGIWNWDSAFHAMGASRFDSELAISCIDVFLSYQFENGFLPDVVFTNGNVVDNCSKPPVMAWAVWEVYQRSGEKKFLKRSYERLVKNIDFWERNRCFNGLFFYSSERDIDKNDYEYAKYESGLDNSPRWDTPIVDLWAIDLNCYMVDSYRHLAMMSEVLQINADWKEKGEKLSKLIEEKLFSSEHSAYCDVSKKTGKATGVLSPASFMPLFIGIASESHAESMKKIAEDKAKFYPGMPSVSYDHPSYSLDYWRGPTWINVAYFAIKGLKNYGFQALAEEYKEYILNMVYENLDKGIFENYDSKERKGLCWHTFSWSAVFVIEFILSF